MARKLKFNMFQVKNRAALGIPNMSHEKMKFLKNIFITSMQRHNIEGHIYFVVCCCFLLQTKIMFLCSSFFIGNTRQGIQKSFKPSKPWFFFSLQDFSTLGHSSFLKSYIKYECTRRIKSSGTWNKKAFLSSFICDDTQTNASELKFSEFTLLSRF